MTTTPAARNHWRMLTGLVRCAANEGYTFINRGRLGAYYVVDVAYGGMVLDSGLSPSYIAAAANALEVVRSHQRRAA